VEQRETIQTKCARYANREKEMKVISDEEIIEMANLAGCTRGSTLNIIAFARLVAEKQRGMDAGICDRFHERQMVPAECAAAIRSQK
jgi:hypothetical protein